MRLFCCFNTILTPCASSTRLPQVDYIFNLFLEVPPVSTHSGLLSYEIVVEPYTFKCLGCGLTINFGVFTIRCALSHLPHDVSLLAAVSKIVQGFPQFKGFLTIDYSIGRQATNLSPHAKQKYRQRDEDIPFFLRESLLDQPLYHPIYILRLSHSLGT